MLVLASHILDSKDGRRLLMDDGAEAGLALDSDAWDTHLATQCGEEHDKFNGVDIVSNDDERRLLGLNESDSMVKAVLHK